MENIEEVELNFNLNDRQLECMELHALFKQNGFYENLEYELADDEFDRVKVWYKMDYNDNWYDARPIYFDLIKENRIIGKRAPYNLGESVEVRKEDVTSGDMLSFIINRQMLK